MKKMLISTKTAHGYRLLFFGYCLLVTAMTVCPLGSVMAQPVADIISKYPAYASCNYNIYPDSVPDDLTPAPAGKHPFYISHYGRHGSRYINNRNGYDTPYKMMLQAESVDELTPTGKKVLQEMKNVLADSEGRWGELTYLGAEQHRWIAHRMVERFPEVFEGDVHVSARSTIVPRCMISMSYALMELAQANPHLKIDMESTKRNQHYLNFQDPVLRKGYMTPEADKAYKAYTATRLGNSRLMEMIFKNPDIVKELVDESFFNYYLMKMGLFILNTHLKDQTFLLGLFQTDELYRMWQIDNVLWYIQHGACKLNGGRQPFTQRHLLRKLIAEADSCIALERPGAQLRFGHETVLLPLVCLIGVDGYDLETDNLDELEDRGWWCSSIFPMGANLQFIFYRSGPDDDDVLLKVLLNEKESTLPISTDCAPYYHWRDFRSYCLNKLDRYQEAEKSIPLKK